MGSGGTLGRVCGCVQIAQLAGIARNSWFIGRQFRGRSVFHLVVDLWSCLLLQAACALSLLKFLAVIFCLPHTIANCSLQGQEPQTSPRPILTIGIRSPIPYGPKLAFFGDFRVFVANGSGLQVWDIAQKSLVTTFGGHSYPIDGLAVCERESLVVTVATREIIVRNAISGNICAIFGWPLEDEHPHVDAVAFVGDGDEILWAGIQGIFVTDIKTGQRRVFRQDGSRALIAAGAGGQLLLVGNSRLQTAALYDLRTKEGRRFFADVKWFPESAISVNGRFIVVLGSDQRVQVRDIETGMIVRSYVGTTFGFSPNGKDVTVMAEQSAQENGATVYTVALWDIESGEKRAQVGPFRYPITAAAFSRSGNLLATCDLQELCVWEVPSGRKVFCANLVKVADMAGIGLGKHSDKLVVALSDRPRKDIYGFAEWDFASGRQTGKTLFSERSSVLHWSVCDNGATIVLRMDGQDQVIKVQDLWKEAELLIIKEPLPFLVSHCAVSPDGSTLAIGDKDGTVHLWNLPTKKLIANIEVGKFPITGLCFDTNGETLFVTAQGTTVWQWDVRTRTRLATYRHDAQAFGATCTDAYLVIGLRREPGFGSFAIWDRLTNQLRTVVTATGRTMGIAPHGHLAVFGGDHGQLVLYDVTQNNPRKRWQAHDGLVSKVLFTADGGRLISVGQDGRCRVWSMPDCREVVTFWHLADGGWFSSTPEGFFDYDGDEGTLRTIRHLEPGRLELIPAEESRRYYNPEAVKRALAGQH